jgi:hypothetical protein
MNDEEINRAIAEHLGCLVLEIGLLKERVDRLEQAGDLLAEWHLAVVTTREKAERDVERWNQAKEPNP